jgi:hypothetical protein
MHFSKARDIFRLLFIDRLVFFWVSFSGRFNITFKMDP